MLLTIDCAGRLLGLFTAEMPEHGVTEVALKLGVSKSKAHALLASLTHVGLLQRTEVGRYRLGWRLLSLGRVLDETTDFRRHAQPIMRILHDRYHETAHLATLHGGRVIYVDRRGAAVAEMPAVGAILPAHCSAVGKVLLAALGPRALVEVVTRHGLEARTPRTITDPLALAEQLDDVRASGYATEREEGIAGMSCVAAPIVAPGPRTVAAVSLCVPTARFDAAESTYRRAVVLASHHISRALRADDVAAAASAATAVPTHDLAAA